MVEGGANAALARWAACARKGLRVDMGVDLSPAYNTVLCCLLAECNVVSKEGGGRILPGSRGNNILVGHEVWASGRLDGSYDCCVHAKALRPRGKVDDFPTFTLA